MTYIGRSTKSIQIRNRPTSWLGLDSGWPWARLSHEAVWIKEVGGVRKWRSVISYFHCSSKHRKRKM